MATLKVEVRWIAGRTAEDDGVRTRTGYDEGTAGGQASQGHH